MEAKPRGRPRKINTDEPTTTYSISHQKYYTKNKDEINEKRREYARQHQREYNQKLRQIKIENGTYIRQGRPNKVAEVVPV